MTIEAPHRVPKTWDATYITSDSAGDLLRKYGVPRAWNDPRECRAWFDSNDEARLIVADYPAGQRAVFRRTLQNWSLSLSQHLVWMGYDPAENVADRVAAA